MTDLIEGARRNSEAGKTFRARLRALRQIIGANIEAVRKGQDMPLRLLAKKTGISAEKLDYWEMGRMEVSLAGIVRIAAALGVPHSRLLDTGTTGEGSTDNAPEQDAVTEDDPEEDTEDAAGKDWLDERVHDLEVEIYQKVAKRERKPEGLPGSSTLLAMEEPLLRVMRSSVLFCDLAYATMNDDPPNPPGLLFLATSMRREADRLIRLYYGHPQD